MFPLMSEAELASLTDDIKANGLVEPIVLSHDGSLLIDGRNRWVACERAGVEPKFGRLDPSYDEVEIIKFIVSKNQIRRHLTAGQSAMVALAIEPKLAEAAKARQREHGKTAPGQKSLETKSPQVKRTPQVRDQLADIFNVSATTVSQAKKVKGTSPELAAQVMAGTITLNDAYKEVRAEERNAPKEQALSKRFVSLLTHTGEKVEYPLPKGKAKFNPQPTKQIDWAAKTWNIVTGCLHNCPYCYAREIALRHRDAFPVGFTPLFHHERLDAPKNTEVPKEAENDPRLKRVFVCSMGDLFGKWVPDDWIEKIFGSCRDNPQWDYLLLTKFPQRYVELQKKQQLPATAWIGTTVDEQYRVKIAEAASRKIKGVRVKWLSCEPLREKLEFSDLSMFDWLVIGSQSATNQPTGPVKEFAPNIEWVMRLIAQARECRVPVYCKPNLLGIPNPQSPGMELPQELPRCFHDRACAIFRGSACDCVHKNRTK
jgi:protein gp37